MNLCSSILLAIAFAFWLGNVVIANPTENVANADELEQRRELLRSATKNVWQSYVKQFITPSNDSISLAIKNRIIVDIMSTLWTMGLVEEFAQGREWISANFANYSQKEDAINVRLYMNELVGGLLSCYALTNDTMFRDKAFEVASVLQGGYDNQTGIAKYDIVPKTGERKPSEKYFLSDIGGSMLEERYLHSLAPEQFVDRTIQWRTFLRNITDSSNRALFSGFNSTTGTFSGIDSTSDTFSGDTLSLTTFQTKLFYANLVKVYAQSNGTDLEAIEMFVKAIETAVELGMISRVNGTEHSYIRDYNRDTKQFTNFMYNAGCNYGALLQIGAGALEAIRQHNQTIASKTAQQLSETISQYRKLSEQITETCHFAANQTVGKLLLYKLFINEQDRLDSLPKDLHWIDYYRMDSGLEESYFVLWRATKDQKYRDYAWELVQAYMRIDKKNWHFDLYSSGFKYLYLIFSDDSLLPSDQWVFTSEGHPLPICGHNGANPKC